MFVSQVSSLRSQLECWNNGTLEYWVLGLRLGESAAQRENGKLCYCKIPIDGNEI